MNKSHKQDCEAHSQLTVNLNYPITEFTISQKNMINMLKLCVHRKTYYCIAVGNFVAPVCM